MVRILEAIDEEQRLSGAFEISHNTRFCTLTHLIEVFTFNHHHKKCGQMFCSLQLEDLRSHNNPKIWLHKVDHLGPTHSTWTHHHSQRNINIMATSCALRIRPFYNDNQPTLASTINELPSTCTWKSTCILCADCFCYVEKTGYMCLLGFMLTTFEVDTHILELLKKV
jgi:hypothetical protein